MGEGATSASQLPSYIIFDRDYIYGSSVTPITHGIYADGAYVGIVDSYCDEIVDSANDAQCIVSTNGTGPFLIQNNFLQSTGENIMFGGADPTISNLVPSDITIVGNLIQKNVAAWRATIVDVKNLFELKNAQRVLLDGNVLQYTWYAAQREAIIIRSVNQSGSCTWCVVQDVTITHNLIQHAPEGIVMAPIQGPQSTNPSPPLQAVLVRNNVFNDISRTNWGAFGWVFELSAATASSQYGPPMHDITIDHNTSFIDPASAGTGSAFAQIDCQCETGDEILNMQVTNNLSDYGASGFSGQNTGSGAIAWTTYILGTAVYNDMAFLTPSGTSSGTYPTGTFWNTLSGVGFTSYSGTDPNLSGNFQLTTSSPYHNAGTDGKDIGVWDWACYNYDTTAAQAGNFVPTAGCSASGTTLLPPPSLSGTLQSGS
jgi:hypothetical protein